MEKFLTSLILVTSVRSPVFGEAKHEQWFKKNCTDLYNSIAIFSSLAEKQWKINEEKAVRYGSAAVDEATTVKLFVTVSRYYFYLRRPDPTFK